MSGKLKARQKSGGTQGNLSDGRQEMWKQGPCQKTPQHQPLPKALSTVLSVKSPGPPNGGGKNNMKWKRNHQKFHLNVRHCTKRVLYAAFILGTVETKSWKKCSYTHETQTLLEDNSSWCGIASLFTNYPWSTVFPAQIYIQQPTLIGFLLLTWLILELPGRHTFPRDS